jgi:hypothetical protein
MKPTKEMGWEEKIKNKVEWYDNIDYWKQTEKRKQGLINGLVKEFATQIKQAEERGKREVLEEMDEEIKSFRHTHAGYSALSAAWRVIKNKLESK